MDSIRPVNPYIAGSPVTGIEMFFGREDVFSFVRRNLTGRHRDAPIVLYGQRRTGKTSVLYQMHRHLDPRYRCIFIDLHGLNLKGVENLLWGLANSIRRGMQRDHQLSVAVPERAAFSLNPQAEFETTFLDAVWSALGEDHLVLMIDEVVRLHEEVQAGRLEREVFDYLRHLMQHFERLNFVFSLGSGVEEMKMDYAFLFGVALYHRISFLEPAAARGLITDPVQGCYQMMPDAVEKILQITTGHPYYTQLVCHCLFDRWLRAPKSQMTSDDVDAVLTEAIELGSANLTYVWEDSTPEEQATMAGMAAAVSAIGRSARIDEIRKVWLKVGMWLPSGEATSAIRNLTAREVVLASDGSYLFAVDLQRLWLDKHRRLDWVKEELGEAALKWNDGPVASVRSHWWLAILSVLFFWPVGIAACVFASRVKHALALGNVTDAMRASKRVIVAFWGSIALLVALVIFFAALGASEKPPSGNPSQVNNPAQIVKLESSVPPEFVKQCNTLAVVDQTLSPGLIAAVQCSPAESGVPEDVAYYLYANIGAMNAVFNAWVGHLPVGGACAGNTGAAGNYHASATHASGGSWLCYRNSSKQSEIAWSSTRLNIISVAASSTETLQQLYHWFSSADVGPD